MFFNNGASSKRGPKIQPSYVVVIHRTLHLALGINIWRALELYQALPAMLLAVACRADKILFIVLTFSFSLKISIAFKNSSQTILTLPNSISIHLYVPPRKNLPLPRPAHSLRTRPFSSRRRCVSRATCSTFSPSD